jgi:lytic murein transglycosylase
MRTYLTALIVAGSALAVTPVAAQAPQADAPAAAVPYRYAATTPRNCVDPAKFPAFLDQMRAQAAAQGVSPRGLAALDGLQFDPNVVSRDRGQKVFTQTFEEFSGRMIPPRLARAKQMMQKHAALIARIEQQFGVPGSVIVAIWGLETDYGAYLGDFNTVRALATLAYDCRRPEKFRPELIAFTKIVDRGDLNPQTAKGAWAGEIGQTQFMPTQYIKYAIDYDGDGHRDLVHSIPDVLASTANYLKGYGWQRGQGWMPGQPNFTVIQDWNKAEVYAKTIASFAQQVEQSRR